MRDVDLLKATSDVSVTTYYQYNDSLTPYNFLANAFFSIRSFCCIFFKVWRNEIDIVHVHNIFPLLSISCLLAAKLAGAKIIMTLHNYRFWCISGSFNRPGKQICMDCISSTFPMNGIIHKCFRNKLVVSIVIQLTITCYKMFNIFKVVDAIQTLSAHQDLLAKRLLPNDIKTINLGHHLSKNHTERSKIFDLNQIECLFVGRLTEEKGFDKIVHIAAALPPNITIHVVGSYDGRFGSLAELSNINYHGSLSQQEVNELMLNTDYLINPSVVFETFGLTNIEALSAGLPIIAQNIGTRPEFVIDGVTGFLYERDGLLGALNRASTFRNQPELSRNASQASKKYRSSSWVLRQVEIYRELLNAK
ncbi:glycosyltransferase family 4 protein [Planktomarina temperata]|nr:glycosyltransferase family 4 protein [Planktomarina temperata]